MTVEEIKEKVRILREDLWRFWSWRLEDGVSREILSTFNTYLTDEALPWRLHKGFINMYYIRYSRSRDDIRLHSSLQFEWLHVLFWKRIPQTVICGFFTNKSLSSWDYLQNYYCGNVTGLGKATITFYCKNCHYSQTRHIGDRSGPCHAVWGCNCCNCIAGESLWSTWQTWPFCVLTLYRQPTGRGQGSGPSSGLTKQWELSLCSCHPSWTDFYRTHDLIHYSIAALYDGLGHLWDYSKDEVISEVYKHQSCKIK